MAPLARVSLGVRRSESLLQKAIQMQKMLKLLCVLVYVAVCGTVAGAEELERIRASFDRIRSAKLAVTVKSTQTVEKEDPKLYKTTSLDYAIDLVQQRFHSIRKSGLSPADGSAGETHRSESLRTKTQYLDVTTGASDKEAIAVSSKVKLNSSEFTDLLSDTELSAAFGYVPRTFGGQRIDSLLDSAMLTKTPGDLSFTVKHEGVTIEAKFDRATLLLKELDARRPVDARFMEHAYHYVVDDSAEVNGILFPTRYRIILERAARTIVPSLGPTTSGRPISLPMPTSLPKDTKRPASRVVRYVAIDANQLNVPLADSAFLMGSKIQNGTRVLMLDARHINFRWFDGAPVAIVDP